MEGAKAPADVLCEGVVDLAHSREAVLPGSQRLVPEGALASPGEPPAIPLSRQGRGLVDVTEDRAAMLLPDPSGVAGVIAVPVGQDHGVEADVAELARQRPALCPVAAVDQDRPRRMPHDPGVRDARQGRQSRVLVEELHGYILRSRLFFFGLPESMGLNQQNGKHTLPSPKEHS